MPETRTAEIVRTPEGRFPPGVSGNPGGQPSGLAEVRQLARTYTELAINTLAEICQSSDKDPARVAAASVLLDRGWGKAQATIEVTGATGGPFPAVKIDLARLDDQEFRQLRSLCMKAKALAEAGESP